MAELREEGSRPFSRAGTSSEMCACARVGRCVGSAQAAESTHGDGTSAPPTKGAQSSEWSESSPRDESRPLGLTGLARRSRTSLSIKKDACKDVLVSFACNEKTIVFC